MSDERQHSKRRMFCDAGLYRDMGITDSTDLHNSGLGVRLVGTTRWTAIECDKFGNVQVFRKSK